MSSQAEHSLRRFVISPSARPPGMRWDGSRRFFRHRHMPPSAAAYLRSETAQASARSPAHVPQRPAGCFRDWTAPARLAALEQLPAGVFFRTDIVRAEQQPDLSGLIGTACQIDQPAVLRRWFLSHVCCLRSCVTAESCRYRQNRTKPTDGFCAELPILLYRSSVEIASRQKGLPGKMAICTKFTADFL